MEEFTFLRYRRFADRMLLLLWILGENFGYRRLTFMWRLRGMLNHVRRSKSWGAIGRRGFAAARPADPRP